MRAIVEAYKILLQNSMYKNNLRYSISLLYRVRIRRLLTQKVVVQNWIADGTAPRMLRIFTRFRFINRFILCYFLSTFISFNNIYRTKSH